MKAKRVTARLFLSIAALALGGCWSDETDIGGVCVDEIAKDANSNQRHVLNEIIAQISDESFQGAPWQKGDGFLGCIEQFANIAEHNENMKHPILVCCKSFRPVSEIE